MWNKNKNGNLEVVNKFGDRVPAEIKAFKYTGIFWKTEKGLWVKKFIAIRNNLKLTGEKMLMTTAPQFSITPK